MSDEIDRDKNVRPGIASPELSPVSGLEHLQYVENERVGLITIDRPEVHNAISLATMTEFDCVLRWLETKSDVGAVVLTGAGDRTFVSGGDLKDFARLETHEAAASMSRRMQSLMARFEMLPIPVIGAINGDCMGGGCEVSLAADIRVVSDGSQFGFKQVALGITPAWGGRRRLVRLIGRAKTLLLLLTGELLDAREAERIGLADKIAPRGQAVKEALELGRQIAANPPMAAKAIKRAVNYDCTANEAEAIEFEADLFAETWISRDHEEALAARREKRRPRFTGT
ncbi:MAG: enoyl-CoA hydratase/isomerase family protein [Deltaproteobacteria bacterium]|nr:enoyl-CoA hydratase/isomerase family protein [Deltaproteobacteria bacterium]